MSNKRKGFEYPLRSGIIITEKKNPTGSIAFRVDIAASLTGKAREQKQFPERRDAQDYAKKRHEEIARFGHAAFALSGNQRQDAERAIQILSGFNLSLEDAAKLATVHAKAAQQPVNVRQLRESFLLAPGRKKSKAIQRRKLTLINLRWRTAKFEKCHGEAMASAIQMQDIKDWLRSLGPLSPVSLNNYRRALHAMFSYGVHEGYCTTNPVSKVPLYDIPDVSPCILTVEEAERLVTAALKSETKLSMLAYISLGLFAGIRRAELEKLDWGAVKWSRKMVTIDGGIAKTGSIRNVSLSENALAWLSCCARRSGRITPPNINVRLRSLRALAEFPRWHRNVLRHSYASYHYDLHQNGPMTAAQLGHTSGTQLLFEHYRSLVPLGDGARFFALYPVIAHAQTATAI